jgi:hypothetical protein
MGLVRSIRRSLRAVLATAALAAAITALAFLVDARPAGASTTQLSMFDLPSLVNTSDPDPMLQSTLLLTDANGAQSTIALRLHAK